MKRPFALRSATLTVALLAGLLSGCGGDKPDTLIASGKEFLAKNDNKAAVIQFKNALQQNPNLGEARFLLGSNCARHLFSNMLLSKPFPCLLNPCSLRVRQRK